MIGTFLPLWLQIWTKGAVATFVGLVQTAEEFKLGWIPLQKPHREEDLFSPRLQLLGVHLNGNGRNKTQRSQRLGSEWP